MHHVPAVRVEHRHQEVPPVADLQVHEVRVPPLVHARRRRGPVPRPTPALPPVQQIRVAQQPIYARRTQVRDVRVDHCHANRR